MAGDDDETFEFDLDLPSEPRPTAPAEVNEIVAEQAPESHEITDVNFHELDLP